MKKTIHLTVRTPEAEILSQPATIIKAATEDGPMIIYPQHASLTGSILFSRLVVGDEHSEKEYLMRNGVIFISVDTKSVNILCYSCQEIKDIEYKTAKEYLEFVEVKLKEGADLNEYQLKFLENEKIAMVQQLRVLEKTEKP